MDQQNINLSREEILYEFAVEEEINEKELKEYQERFPELSKELLDLYSELKSETIYKEKPLSDEDRKWIDEAYKKHIAVV